MQLEAAHQVEIFRLSCGGCRKMYTNVMSEIMQQMFKIIEKWLNAYELNVNPGKTGFSFFTRERKFKLI